MTTPPPPTPPTPYHPSETLSDDLHLASHPLADIFPDSPPRTPSLSSPRSDPSLSGPHSNPHPSNAPLSAHPSQPPLSSHPSDIPRLHATHATAGYRNGISAAKSASLQPGFDEGYSLGAVLGLRVGYVLGVLEGLWGAFAKAARGDWVAIERERLGGVLREARAELVMERVFGKEWWAEDGVWRFEVEVEGEGEGGEVTFEMVADKHPLLEKWSLRVSEEMRRLGVHEGRFEGEEWESGRVTDDGGGGEPAARNDDGSSL